MLSAQLRRVKLAVECLEGRVVPSFMPAANYDVGLAPTLVQTGDFNNDGHLDLITVNADDTSLSVLLGRGDGTFGPALSHSLGLFTRSMALGDVNNDSNLDVAVLYHDNINRVDVWLGRGDGSFQGPLATAIGTSIESFELGDLNEDHKLDLVVPTFAPDGCTRIFCEGPGGSSRTYIFLGNGDGSFQQGASYDNESGGHNQTFIRDFNDDGKSDILVAGGSSSVLLGHGDGTFQSGFSVGHQGGGTFVIGDFDRDGKLDLASADASVSALSYFNEEWYKTHDLSNSFWTSSFLVSQSGVGDGTFGPETIAPIYDGATSDLLAGDFNGDGNLDLARLLLSYYHDSYFLHLMKGRGDGTFRTIGDAYTSGLGPTSLTAGDFNTDGRLDLAVANAGSNNVSILIDVPDPTETLVSKLYTDLLGRRADSAGFWFWAGRLDDGTSRSWIVRAFQTSSEYRNKVVDSLYERYLGRDADPAGLDFALDFLASGGTAEQFQASILGSPEYLQKQADGTTAGFLAVLYDDVLGRTIDTPGAAFWALQVDGSPASRTQVALAILQAPESNRRELDAIYIQYLRRSADPAGLDYFAGLMQRDTSNEYVIRALLSSYEYSPQSQRIFR